MKKYLLSTFASLSLVSAFGQTDPLYAQYPNNPYLLNPGYAGFHKSLNASFSYRKQWAGFDGSPETFNATIHSSIRNNTMGAGLIVLQDKIGITANTEIQASVAYKINLEKKSLSFGMQAGLVNFRNNFSDLNVYDANGAEFGSDQQYLKPTIGAGIILSSDRYFIGVSVPRLLKSVAEVEGTTVALYKQHFYLSGSYIVFLSERVRCKPSVLLKAVPGSPVSVDYNVLFNVDERYSAGLISRNFNTYGILTQIRLNDRYRFGYAFEVPTNGSVGTRYTSHELTLGISLAALTFHDTSAITSF